jgi:hypothetical protein
VIAASKITRIEQFSIECPRKFFCASGLGAAIALGFAQAGADVALPIEMLLRQTTWQYSVLASATPSHFQLKLLRRCRLISLQIRFQSGSDEWTFS